MDEVNDILDTSHHVTWCEPVGLTLWVKCSHAGLGVYLGVEFSVMREGKRKLEKGNSFDKSSVAFKVK